MKVFIYYSKFDPQKEPQGKVKANNLQEAIQFISQIKRLEQNKFLQIFEIKEI